MIVVGGVRHPTKVEVSFRKRHAADRAVLDTTDPGILETYGLDPLNVRHYVREAAVRQKLEALAGRREAQARDVFDLQVLVPDVPTEALLEFLEKALRRDRLGEAYGRALAISYKEHQGQVFEFLGEEARSRAHTGRGSLPGSGSSPPPLHVPGNRPSRRWDSLEPRPVRSPAAAPEDLPHQEDVPAILRSIRRLLETDDVLGCGLRTLYECSMMAIRSKYERHLCQWLG